MPIYRARQLVRSWALVTWSNSAGTSAWQTTATRRLRHARETQAALITRELDFADVRRYPPEQHAGIVVLRRPDDAVAFEIVNVLVRFTRNPLFTIQLAGGSLSWRKIGSDFVLHWSEAKRTGDVMRLFKRSANVAINASQPATPSALQCSQGGRDENRRKIRNRRCCRYQSTGLLAASTGPPPRRP
jgi:hypothetical protein